MSIQSEIERISGEVGDQAELIGQIRSALVGKGAGDALMTIEPLSVTENGTYTAPSGTNGYDPVTVNVPQPSGSIPITENGTHDVAAYASADVNVPQPSGSITITENGTHNIAAYASANVNVSSAGGKNIQYSPNVSKLTNKTSYTETTASIVVEKTGTYKCTWLHYSYAASSSYYLTRLYVNGSAVGSTHACPAYNGTSGWVATESSIALTEGQTVTVRARTRSGSSYYTVAGMLVIEEL